MNLGAAELELEALPEHEAAGLRRCIRDLVALSTLSAAWAHAEPLGVVESLAEVVLRILGLDVAYVRVPHAAGARLEAGRTKASAGLSGRGDELGRKLEAHVSFEGAPAPKSIPALDGGGPPLYVALVPVGADRDCGWLLAASRRADFPVEHERLLLGVAANQLAMVLQRKSAEQRLRDSAARLAEADRRKDEFLATLAHELRNPLAPLSNGVALLRLAADKPQVAAEARDMMGRQVEQLVRLVDDLLDMSRISTGKIELRREWTELGAIVRSARETVDPLVERSGHALNVTLPAEPIYVYADRVRLAQVFCNLLNNAVKYTERGGRIELVAARREADVEVIVRDSGIGMTPELLGRAFDMFAQGEGTFGRPNAGLGIGLTIVKRLVELHGGSVEARSEGPGRGSELIVRLPLEAGAGARDATPRPATPAMTPRRRILIADDNTDAATSLALLLKMQGNEVHVASDGLAAVEAAEALQPELIVLDIGMPKMDGYQACKAIRGRPWGSRAKLVALSGWGQDEHKARAREAGFDHFLVKPVAAEALQLLLGPMPPQR